MARPEIVSTELFEVALPLVGLETQKEWSESIIARFAMAANAAALLMDFPLDDVSDELAPVFRPGSSRALQ